MKEYRIEFVVKVPESYFFGFSVFFGRPLPGTLRIISMADESYIAVGPAYETGCIPAIRRRILTAGCPSSNFSAISLIVNPFILLISEIIQKILEKSIEFVRLILTKSIERDRLKIYWLTTGMT